MISRGGPLIYREFEFLDQLFGPATSLKRSKSKTIEQ